MVFAPGNNANPSGRPSKSADFVERLHHWITTHTVEDITKIYLDKKQFNKLSVTDGLCCQRLYEALQHRGGNTMEQLFDRLLGKPSQHTTIDARVLAQVSVDVADRKAQARIEAQAMLDAIALRGASAVLLPSPASEPVTIEHTPQAKPEKVRESRREKSERIKRQIAAGIMDAKPKPVVIE